MLNCGIDLVTVAIKQAIGQSINDDEIVSKYNNYISDRWWIPEPGRVTEIINKDKYIDHPNVKLLEIRVKPGDIIEEVTSHSSRGGVVIVSGIDRPSAMQLADKIINDVKIITTPI